MAEAKKNIKKVGGQKKNSARRPSSTRRKRREMSRWKYVAIATIVTAAVLALAYRPLLRPAFTRFIPCNGHKIYGACIPKGYSVYGIDVSHHQGNINWSTLREGNPGEPPISFVYMKATEGSDHSDTRFKRNWKNAKENGFVRGAYHYFSTTSTGEAQARMFINSVNLTAGDLPPMVDVEDEPRNKSAYQAELKQFITIIEQHYGVKPIIYTYKKFKERYIDCSLFEGYPIWIAQYKTKQPQIEGEWILWQCTRNGRLPGISHKVDINIFNGSVHDLENLRIKQ